MTEIITEENNTMVHLAYCDNKEKVLEKIMNGSKTMIVRGAAGKKIPHSRVFKDEILYLMKKGSAQITAKAKIVNVKNYVKLSEEEINDVFNKNQEKLNLSPTQRKRWHKKCLCLIEFSDLQEIDPLPFDRQGNMDDWLIVEKIEDVVIGTSIPYNYEKSRFKK
jgi:hypothetical protein